MNKTLNERLGLVCKAYSKKYLGGKINHQTQGSMHLKKTKPNPTLHCSYAQTRLSKL